MTTDELINTIQNADIRNRIFIEAVDVAITEFPTLTSNTARKNFLTQVFDADTHDSDPIKKLVRWIVISNRGISVEQLDTASQNSTTVQNAIKAALTVWFGAVA